MSSDTSQISEREREILRLVAMGATNQQIANQLNISVNTVKVHLRNIFGKIGVVSRTEATLFAVRSGLVQVAEGPAANQSAVAVVADEPPPAHTSEPIATVMPQSLPDRADVARQDELGVPEARERVELPAGRPVEEVAAEDQPPPTPAPVGPVAAGLGRNWLLGAGLLVLLLVAAVLVATATGILRIAPAPAATPEIGSLGVPDTRWKSLASMPAANSGFALASSTFNGKTYLYVVGGEQNGQVSNQVLRYDISTDTWVPFSSKPTPVSDVQAAVIGNRLYVPGGRLASGAPTDVFEAYDPHTDRWRVLRSLPEPRSGYALAAVEGKLYLFGGWDGTRYRAEVWQYNPDQDTWSERTAMPTARAFAAAATLDDLVYVVGGENQGQRLTVNERYAPAEDTGSGNPWSVVAPLLTPRSHAAVASGGGRLFVFGGAGEGDESLVYNRDVDAWQSRSDIPIDDRLDGMRAQAIGNKIYIFGGRSAEIASAQAYEYQALYTVLLPEISK